MEGLGRIARNWAFFDISASFSNSFFFSLLLSGKQVRGNDKIEGINLLLRRK